MPRSETEAARRRRVAERLWEQLEDAETPEDAIAMIVRALAAEARRARRAKRGATARRNRRPEGRGRAHGQR